MFCPTTHGSSLRHWVRFKISCLLFTIFSTYISTVMWCIISFGEILGTSIMCVLQLAVLIWSILTFTRYKTRLDYYQQIRMDEGIFPHTNDFDAENANNKTLGLMIVSLWLGCEKCNNTSFVAKCIKYVFSRGKNLALLSLSDIAICLSISYKNCERFLPMNVLLIYLQVHSLVLLLETDVLFYVQLTMNCLTFCVFMWISFSDKPRCISCYCSSYYYTYHNIQKFISMVSAYERYRILRASHITQSQNTEEGKIIVQARKKLNLLDFVRMYYGFPNMPGFWNTEWVKREDDTEDKRTLFIDRYNQGYDIPACYRYETRLIELARANHVTSAMMESMHVLFVYLSGITHVGWSSPNRLPYLNNCKHVKWEDTLENEISIEVLLDQGLIKPIVDIIVKDYLYNPPISQHLRITDIEENKFDIP